MSAAAAHPVVADRLQRFAAVYDGPWDPADALVWALDPDAAAPSGAPPPGLALAALRDRVYGPRARPDDVDVYRGAVAGVDRLRRQAQDAAARAGIDLDPPVPDGSDAVADEPDGDPATAAASPRFTRRRAVQVGALVVVAGAAAGAAAIVNRPPDLGPSTRPTTSWARLPAAPVVAATTIDSTDLSSKSAAIAFLDVPSTTAERIMAPRSPFFARGSGGMDFDVQHFDVGVANVAIAVACDAATELTAELGVLAGVHTRTPQTALRITGRVEPGVIMMSVRPITPFERPRILRVNTDPSVHYLIRAVFVGTRMTP